MVFTSTGSRNGAGTVNHSSENSRQRPPASAGFNSLSQKGSLIGLDLNDIAYLETDDTGGPPSFSDEDEFFKITRQEPLLSLSRGDFQSICAVYEEMPGHADDILTIQFTFSEAALTNYRQVAEANMTTRDRRIPIQLIPSNQAIRLQGVFGPDPVYHEAPEDAASFKNAVEADIESGKHLSLVYSERDFPILAAVIWFWNPIEMSVPICEGRQSAKTQYEIADILLKSVEGDTQR